MKLYLDVCCLNRPFDDQSQPKIHLETEAIISILEKFQEGKVEIFSSDIINFEVSKIPDLERKEKVTMIIEQLSDKIEYHEKIKTRANEFMEFGLNLVDAIHIASAEDAKLDMFLTTDENIIHVYNNMSDKFSIPIINPVDWIREEF